MLYWLLSSLGDTLTGFNVFRYLTFRTGLAMTTAFFLSLIAGPWLINSLRSLQVRQELAGTRPDDRSMPGGPGPPTRFHPIQCEPSWSKADPDSRGRSVRQATRTRPFRPSPRPS